MDAGANKDLTDLVGGTALMFACGNGHLEAASFLIEAGADKDTIAGNATAGYGCTAAQIAQDNDHAEIVRLLS